MEETERLEIPVLPIGEQQLREFMAILQSYKAGKSQTEQRIVSSENWWKLRNTMEEQKKTGIGLDGGFASRSGWLHNVIVSKHADAMEGYPEPNILPREASDREEALRLGAIIPCVLEQNGFEKTWSDVMWQKLKTGTGAYKVVWDPEKLYGLGDISVEQVNLLNLYWEPGVTDIQKSRYFFHTELWEEEALLERYPSLQGKLRGKSFMSTRFLYDDHVDTQNKHTVIEVYYRKPAAGRKILHYCRFVGDQVLFSTENHPVMSLQGLYDHGNYPYVFDVLYPVEGSPCGYGFVDVCRNPQTEIDLMKTAFLKNTMMGATPRYFSRGDGAVNEEEFLDLSKPIVHVASAGEDALRQITFHRLDGVYVNMLDRTIQELRETSGNTETSTGNIASGVTAASAIAALQEASGKGSRDSTLGAYRAYTRIVELCIELIRQFYSLPRQFRITGELGSPKFISYTNQALRPQHQGSVFGVDQGYRLPVFDIRVSAQKRNPYSSMAQNELALQFFRLGFFNPALADQAMACLDMMQFDGKEGVLQKIAANARLHRMGDVYRNLAAALADRVDPALAQRLRGGAAEKPVPAARLPKVENREAAGAENARQSAAAASVPVAAAAGKEAGA